LIGDSESDQALDPHQLLLLYNKNISITLVLTKHIDNESYQLIASYAVNQANTQPANAD